MTPSEIEETLETSYPPTTLWFVGEADLRLTHELVDLFFQDEDLSDDTYELVDGHVYAYCPTGQVRNGGRSLCQRWGDIRKLRDLKAYARPWISEHQDWQPQVREILMKSGAN